jgi:Fe-S-cluster containining protein
VQVTPPEAFLISHYVARRQSPEARARLRERLDDTRRRLAGLSLEEVGRRRRQFPCPFLEEDRCSIYPVRPLSCRAMHSFDLDQCRTEWETESLAPVSYYAHRHEIILSISHGLLEGCRQAGCQAQPLHLVHGLWTIVNGSDCDHRWARGEMVFGGGGG